MGTPSINGPDIGFSKILIYVDIHCTVFVPHGDGENEIMKAAISDWALSGKNIAFQK